MEFSSKRRWGCIGPSNKVLCLSKIEKNLQHTLGIIQYMFDCWTDPVVHLLLLKSPIVRPYDCTFLLSKLLSIFNSTIPLFEIFRFVNGYVGWKQPQLSKYIDPLPPFKLYIGDNRLFPFDVCDVGTARWIEFAHSFTL